MHGANLKLKSDATRRNNIFPNAKYNGYPGGIRFHDQENHFS